MQKLLSKLDNKQFQRLGIFTTNAVKFIVGLAVLRVAASVLAVVWKRMQQLPTMLGPVVHRGLCKDFEIHVCNSLAWPQQCWKSCVNRCATNADCRLADWQVNEENLTLLWNALADSLSLKCKSFKSLVQGQGIYYSILQQWLPVCSLRLSHTVCKRIQNCCAALHRTKKCCELSALKFDRYQTLRNNSEQHATTFNSFCKRTQHVTSNYVRICCPTMLCPFARHFKFGTCETRRLKWAFRHWTISDRLKL